MSDLLTVAQTAEAMGVSERFIRRLIYERRIEVVRLGRHVRIRDAAIHQFIVAGTSEALR